MALVFDRSLDVPHGQAVPLSPLVTRLLAPNPSPFTFKGTGVYIMGAGASVAVIDPGPAIPAHIEALKRALGTRRVSHILVTHTHNDHSPAAAALKAWSGARTYAAAPAPQAAALEGAVDEAHDHAFVPDVIVRDGDTLTGDGFTLDARRHARPHRQPHVLRAGRRSAPCSAAIMSWAGRPASSPRPMATWAPTWPAWKS